MKYIAYSFLVVYAVALFYIMVFCLVQLQLLIFYTRRKKNDKKISNQAAWPDVTIQLPIYNEKFVVERLIDNIVKMDYPSEKLEIRILDDSTDDTVQIVKNKVEEYRAKGINIVQVRRANRTGYKAGALRDDMKDAKGAFFAIFDADFMPLPDFLKRTIPYFSDPKIGVVQTRWGHLNENYSLITRLQAFQLNVHFTVEQVGREIGDYFLQFNGTGGVWRKSTIEAAGGWQPDTLTEDLDLSVRAQLNGYKIHYLEDTVSPAELPSEMNGLKSQQHRWMKGGAETAKKLLPKVWKSDLSFNKKMHASFHLLASSIFLFVFTVGIFSVPLLLLMENFTFPLQYFSVFLASFLSVVAVYYVGNVHSAWKGETWLKKFFKFLFLFPVFLALSMGLSLHNSIAVIQGYLGKKSAFVRTPKFNIQSVADKINKNQYLATKIPLTTIFEGILCVYFCFAIYYAVLNQNYTFILFHMLLALGFGSICYYSIKHLRLNG